MLVQTVKSQGAVFKQILTYFQQHGLQCSSVADSDIVEVKYKEHVEYLMDDEYPYIPLGYKNIVYDRLNLKAMFFELGLPAFMGERFHHQALSAALAYSEEHLLWPLRMTPWKKYRNRPSFVVESAESLTVLWETQVLPYSGDYILLENALPYCPYYQLVCFKTGERMALGFSALPHYYSVSKEHSSIYSLAAECFHPSIWQAVEKLWQVFPELPFLCVDLQTAAREQSVDDCPPVWIDIHTAPTWEPYVFPQQKPSWNVVPLLAQLIFPEISDG